ncbi:MULTISPECIES: hypothetical protein [Streptomyces]|uniref:Uncharacterized protein n=2 Tax=Streptomyces fradiae TaxID=1906 RepID=A0A1Y2P2I9_STRFR|nr:MULTISPECIES: hypothetical protein [Streptomyces]KAF0647590.1 hypothetical protein K701_22735 [Streptomyces fradiae ATCC 10745 = DSM 40063]OSY54043.1 hypothetical protein BG846_00280 [Streptomyces fradiae ATCC 10745 = DSM 40063]
MAMDVESVADELYGLRPSEFTALRERRAAEARTAGDRALADRVKALRRPTAAAWASNLLVRARPDDARSLVALGEALRRAHRDLDGARLRELGRQQHVLVAALAREAQRLTAEAGERIRDSARGQVEATLHAALADPEAAGEWLAGRLSRALDVPVGFAALGDGGGSAARHLSVVRTAPGSGGAEEGDRPEHGGRRSDGAAGAGTKPAHPGARERPEAERPGAAERRREEERRARMRLEEERRTEAAAARREAAAREDEVRHAADALEGAEQRAHEADVRVAELTARLREAQARGEAARLAVQQARLRVREAQRAARGAARRAREAVTRLEGRPAARRGR